MADRRRLDAVCTYTGRAIRPLDPRPADIDIEDIAHSLANQCRFTGHTRQFYSVAQHSVHVSQLCPNYPLEGLLHDASEAYLSDIARPIKKAEGDFGEIYEDIETNLMIAIWERFEVTLSADALAEVKTADNILIGAEARDLMHPNFSEFGMGKFDSDLWQAKIIPWASDYAEIAFLAYFNDYFKNE